MSVQREGLLLETLTRRLAETPPDFLDEPSGNGALNGIPVEVSPMS